MHLQVSIRHSSDDATTNPLRTIDVSLKQHQLSNTGALCHISDHQLAPWGADRTK